MTNVLMVLTFGVMVWLCFSAARMYWARSSRKGEGPLDLGIFEIRDPEDSHARFGDKPPF